MFCALLRNSRVPLSFLLITASRNAQSGCRAFASSLENVCISVCTTAQEFEEARRLWEQMKYRGNKPEAGCYPLLLDGFVKFGSLDETFEMFREMVEVGVRPSAQASSNMIARLGNMDMLDEVAKIFQDVRRLGKPDPSLYTTMVWVLCQRERPKDAEGYLRLMVEDGMDMDDVSCNVIMSTYMRLGFYEECIKVYAYMKSNVPVINSGTHSLMLDVYLKLGRFWNFDKLFKKIQRRKFSYAGMIEKTIDFYASTTRSRDAELLYDKMKDHRIVMSIAGYNKLMELFVNAENSAMVEKVYRELPRGVLPDETTKKWLMRAYLRAGNHGKAFEIYEEIVCDGGAIRDEQSCLLLLRAFVTSQRLPEAKTLALEMRSSGMHIGNDLYQTVFDERK